MPRLLTDEEITRQLIELADWQRDGNAIVRRATLPTFMAGIAAVQDIAQTAEAMDHHPDIGIRWRTLTFTLATHSAGGITQLDIELAHRINEAVTDAANA